MKKLLFCFIFYGGLACNSPKKKQQAKTEGIQKTEIFPVKSFFEAQVHFVDSLQLPVVKYTTVNNLTDTLLMSQGEFAKLARNFTSRYYITIDKPGITRRPDSQTNPCLA
jgi:hypothetical protein